MGKVKPGERRVFPVAPGRHEIELRIDWTGSPTVEVSLAAGEAATLECASLTKPFSAMFRAVFKRREYIQLSRVE